MYNNEVIRSLTMSDYVIKNLPPLVKGTLSKETWNEERRKELLEFFRHEVYGIIPDGDSLSVSIRAADECSGVMDGRAIRKIVEVCVRRKEREFSFTFLVFIPNTAEQKPVPAIISLQGSLPDPTRRHLDSSWPAETVISRGYAAVGLFNQDVAPDYDERFTTKFYRLFPEYADKRPKDMMGTISAWAWGMSRVVDYLLSDPLINGEIAVVGHSRGGKTALWCGVQDPRVTLTISSCSGCSGAAITRGKGGEHIKDITSSFPYWFCDNYKKYADDETNMPFDQHLLAALLAPRLFYINSKSYDSWCDPKAEFECAKQASPAWGVYGKTGLPVSEMPKPETPIHSGNIGYHLKTGHHFLDEYDWDNYLDFMDRHFHKGA
jgi:pimeloyl-ACP methyl ester carboxylesterase